MTYRFGDVELDTDQLELRRDGARIALEPQAFDVLVHLVLHRDRVVPKEELMDQVWGGRFVSETAVTSRIKQVRRALGDTGQSQTHIRTYHGRGYRFVVPVDGDGPPASSEESPSAEPSPVEVGGPIGTSSSVPAPHAATPPVLSAGTGSAPVRFQLSGQGPPDLLLLPPVDSLSQDWDDATGAELLGRLGSRGRLVRVERQRPGEAAGEESADDLELLLTALEGAACERAVVLARNGGAALAVRLAVAHPERVTGLILYGAELDPQALSTAAPEQVACPTLVLHRTADPEVPVARAKAWAAAIPGAEFVALSGSAPTSEVDPDQLLAAVGELVDDAALRETERRTLTALVGLSGDDVATLASVLVELGGKVRQGPEEAVVVSFPGPANALNALGSRRARGLLSDVGIGVAIDEIPPDSRLVAGHGVDVARLFAQRAQRGEVLLPNVIRHLLAGSGLVVEALEPVDLPHVGPHPVNRWLRGS